VVIGNGGFVSRRVVVEEANGIVVVILHLSLELAHARALQDSSSSSLLLLSEWFPERALEIKSNPIQSNPIE
jgi:hypothetical protein